MRRTFRMKSDPRLVTNLIIGLHNRASDIYGERLATATNTVYIISIYYCLIMVSQFDSPKICSFYSIEKIYELLKDFMKNNDKKLKKTPYFSEGVHRNMGHFWGNDKFLFIVKINSKCFNSGGGPVYWAPSSKKPPSGPR